MQIGAGGLQRVQHEAGALAVKASVEDGLRYLHQRHLNGVGIFQWRQLERRALVVLRRLLALQLAAQAVEMEEAEVAFAQGGRFAEASVGFHMFTSTRCHKSCFRVVAMSC